MIRNQIFLVLVLFLSLVACKDAKQIESNEFKILWEQSNNHSATSWWYLGETKFHYFIAQQWPTKKIVYQLKKDKIEILGIKNFKPKPSNKPVNLKAKNVKFK